VKPCLFCGEQIQPAAVKCRFCGEWLDPSKRPAWSGQEVAVLTEQIAREVARQLAPQSAEGEARASSTPRRRPSTRDIPSEPSATSVVAPDDKGRAAGSLDTRLGLEPHVTPAYEPPGPYPGKRELGQPAPRGARWQPGGEDSGPQAAAPSWQPPLSEEPLRSEPEPQPQATVSDSVWQAPAWLRPEEAAAARPQTPTWTPPIEHKPATPSWAAPATPVSPMASPPPWSPPAAAPATAVAEPAPRARAPRIPELGLEHEPAPAKPEFSTPAAYPKDDDEFVDGGFADEFDDEFEDQPATRTPAIEAQPKPTEERKGKPGKQSKQAEPAVAPAAEARPRAKPPKDEDDDDFDDDDDDFDDDDDDDDDFNDDDDRGSMAGEIMTSSIAAPVQPRKLPWIPIALVASVLVMVSAYAFRDTIFGSASEDPAPEEGTEEVVENQPEPDPQPEPEPEPEPQPEPKPEPPPAIPAEELQAKLDEATNLVNRQKHADATKIIDEILGKIPKEPRALSLRAITQLEGRKHQDALVTANECVEADAGQANCWITIAVVEQENDNLPRALEGYRKYLELEPSGRFAKEAKRQADRLSTKVEG
jgi:hypothetical protein